MRKKVKIVGFIALSIAMFMGMLDSTIINIALPDITKYFHENMTDTSWISTVYVMGLAVFMITFAKLADIFGRKKFMILGLVLFGGSSALCGLTTSLNQLILARLLQSLGGAIIMPLVIPMGLEVFGKAQLRPVGSAVGAVTALAAASGPPIGGLIIKYLSWQYIFYVNVPFAVISLVLILVFIDESYDTTISKKIDWAGLVLITASLFLLTFALLKGNDYGWGSALIIAMFAGALVSLVLFILIEPRLSNPMIDFTLFKERTFAASAVCCVFVGFGITSPILIFSYFLQNARGYDALTAALIIMAVAVTVIFSMPLGTLLSDKLGAKPVIFLGFIIMAVGVYLLAIVKMDTPDVTMIIDMVICGIGLGFAFQSLISAVKYIPVEKSGVASGVVNAARQVGVCIGVALMVSLLTAHVKSATNDFKTDAAATINGSAVADPVKAVMLADISAINGNDYTTGSESTDLQNKLQTDITNAVSSLSSAPDPSDGTAKLLYDAAASLQDGSQKALDGQTKLDSGITAFQDGLTKLQDGSNTLKAELAKLQGGLTQAQAGVKTMAAGGTAGIAALQDGVDKLLAGAYQLQAQLAPSGSAGSPSLADGTAAVASGAAGLSSGVSSYVSAVDGTLFAMIKNNPGAPSLLSGYQASLQKAMAGAAGVTDPAAKAKLMQQIQSLQNLVNLYTAGTDASVTTPQQFADKLASLADASPNGANVVAAGNELAAHAVMLSDASKRLSAALGSAGALQNGANQLVAGLETLKQSSGSLTALQTGAAGLSDALGKLTSGAQALAGGADQLSAGLADAVKSGNDLKSGSAQLVSGDTDLLNGTKKLTDGVGLAGQQQLITDVVDKIKADKDEKIATAFNSTFLVAAIIVAVTSFAGLFTDKKMKMVLVEEEKETV